MHPNPYWTPFHFFFQMGLAEPDLKFVDLKSSPPGSEKMPPFVNDDHEIEDHDHEKQDPEELKNAENRVH